MKKIQCIPEPHQHIEILSLIHNNPLHNITITVGVRKNTPFDCEECGLTITEKIYILPICLHENHAECFLKMSENNNVFICLVCKRQLQSHENFSWDISYVS